MKSKKDGREKVMSERKTKYYVLKEKAVPEVLLKVIEAKKLMERRYFDASLSTEATKAGAVRFALS